jgi:hypothetical protein
MHPLLLCTAVAPAVLTAAPDAVRLINQVRAGAGEVVGRLTPGVMQHTAILEADGALVTAAATLHRTRMHAVYSNVPPLEIELRDDASQMEQLLDAMTAIAPDSLRVAVLAVGAVGPSTASASLSGVAARDCGAAAAASAGMLSRVAGAVVMDSDLFECVSDADPFATQRLFVPAARAPVNRLEAAGRLLGRCVADGVPVGLPLAPVVLRRLASPHAPSATLRDLELVAPEESLRARRAAALGDSGRADLAVRDVVDAGRSGALDALARGFQSVPAAAAVAQSLSSAQLAVFLGCASPAELPVSRLQFVGFDAASRAPDIVRALVAALAPLCVRRLCVAVAGTAFTPSDTSIIGVFARVGMLTAAPATVGVGLVLPDLQDERALAQALVDVLISVDGV